MRDQILSRTGSVYSNDLALGKTELVISSPFPFPWVSSRVIGRPPGRERVRAFVLAFVMGSLFKAFHLTTTHWDKMSSSLGYSAAGAASGHSVRAT